MNHFFFFFFFFEDDDLPYRCLGKNGFVGSYFPTAYIPTVYFTYCGGTTDSARYKLTLSKGNDFPERVVFIFINSYSASSL